MPSNNSQVRGTITAIQRFSIHDGPGIRTTVFFKGCNMRCGWCCNPECIDPNIQIKTTGQLVGREVSVDELVHDLCKDLPYYRQSEGGVTLSGGEPLMQCPFILEVATILRKREIHVAIETNSSLWHKYPELLEVIDYVITDIKVIDPIKHRKKTGILNNHVLANINNLACQSDKPLLIRTPIIPDLNDTEADIEEIAHFVKELRHTDSNCYFRRDPTAKLRYVCKSRSVWFELLPFHQYAATKYESLGLSYELEGASIQSAERLAQLSAIVDSILLDNTRFGIPDIPDRSQISDVPKTDTEMSVRAQQIRTSIVNEIPRLATSRAKLITEFYRTNENEMSVPVLRARSLYHLCEFLDIQINDNELIVGDRAAGIKRVPSYPEFFPHTRNDIEAIRIGPQKYRSDEIDAKIYSEDVFPFWEKRCFRAKLTEATSKEFFDCLQTGVFTTFIDTWTVGTGTCVDRIYRMGMSDIKIEIEAHLNELSSDLSASSEHKRQNLLAFSIAADAVMLLARRHADLAGRMAATETNPDRKHELLSIQRVNERVPANSPTTLWEAIQMYWWCHCVMAMETHLAAITPGKLDQHLFPFYQSDLETKKIDKQFARELIECLMLKMSGLLAAPKDKGESTTYQFFTNIAMGGINSEGQNAVNELSYLLLDVIGDLHMTMPLSHIDMNKDTPDEFVFKAVDKLKFGTGLPSFFNTDVTTRILREENWPLEDCYNGVPTDCLDPLVSGKEFLSVTGYFNAAKCVECALSNGADVLTGLQVGAFSGYPSDFTSMDDVWAAVCIQAHHFLEVKLTADWICERLHAELLPTPFRSICFEGCTTSGLDHNEGGTTYRTNSMGISCLASAADCLVAIEEIVFQSRLISMDQLITAMRCNFQSVNHEYEWIRERLKQCDSYGNNADRVDKYAIKLMDLFLGIVDGRPVFNGGKHRLAAAAVTSHVHFGSLMGALPNGRRAGEALSEGISPTQGADLNSPTAVLLSASKLPHSKMRGNILNLKLTPSFFDDITGIHAITQLIRTYFACGGYQIQFNVVDAATLKRAQKQPHLYRDLIVRVAGYSDYFVDLSKALQDEIIARTEHGAVTTDRLDW